MGKTRDLFKKIRDTKGVFHAEMGTTKDRNGTDLTQSEDIKNRWWEYTELYKNDLLDPNNHDGVITHLEPDILECEVKWALESITMNKASGGDGISAELFQIQKDDSVKVLHSYASYLDNSAVATGLGKCQFSLQSQGKAMPKNTQTNAQSHSSHILATSCPKFSRPGFNSMWTENFQMFKLDLGKAEEQEIKLPTYAESLKKQESSRKTSTSALLTTPKPLCGSQQTGKFLIDGNTRPPYGSPEKSVCRSRSNSWSQTWNNGLGQIAKGMSQGCILSLCLFNLNVEYIMWNVGLDEAQAGIKITGRNINNLRYIDDTTLMAEIKELKSPLIIGKGKRENLSIA